MEMKVDQTTFSISLVSLYWEVLHLNANNNLLFRFMETPIN